ncbi:MAG: hypothetical protein LLF89_08700, partial [Spirochaetaceae bacterium]|nr:hypothetical protein [Spirochaetaceae bacterium]
PIAGGVIAALIMSNGANALNLPMVSLLALLLLVLQGFVGYPVASFCLKKEAKLLAKQYKESNGAAGTGADAGFGEEVEIRPKYRFIPELPKSAQTPYMLLAKVSLTALFSYWFAGALGGVIDKNIMCLLIGIIFTEIGFLEKDILTKANSFGLAMAGLITVVFANLAKATPDMVVQIIEPILITLVLGVIGIGVFSILAGKLLGESWPMSFAIGTTALFGFPGTYVLSTEVSKSIGGSEQEKKYIMNNIFPKMMIAGFVTVTVGSVILAGIMVKML